MVTMAEGGLSVHLFNLQKVLNHRVTVLSVTALLACYVLWQTGSLVWKFWLLSNEPPQAAALAPASLRSTERESLQDLLSYPLIHSEVQPATGTSASADQPRTSLNLKLVGLMYSADQNQARAIIESEEDGARSYSTHERVADKVEIHSIEPDRVILLHAGRQESLMLDPEEESSGTGAEAENQGSSDSGSDGASAQVQSSSGRSSGKSSRNIEDVMRDFSATPVMEADELVGFRLNSEQSPALMSEWGIRPDDVITAVNGTPLNSQGRLMVLYDKLKKQREFELTLSNGGKERTITVDLEE